MDDFEGLLEDLVPGAGRRAAGTDLEAPVFPRELGLEPLGLIGRGASGWVFRARDPVLDREVAVKISRPDQGATARDSLLAEARRTARLDHPSVLPVHRLVVAGGLVCVEYRLAPLRTLDALFSDPEDLAGRSIVARLALLRGPVGALRVAHRQGLVHGDVHPANLLIGTDDTVYLLDWAGTVSEAGLLSGTPTHAANEVLAGQRHTPVSDVFGIGAVAWELCAGRPLRPRRHGEDLGAFVARWQARAAPRLPEGVVVPPGVPELLAGALHPDPARRLDMEGLSVALDAALSGAAERAGRRERRDALLSTARDALIRYRSLGRELDDERTVVAIQHARVPGHAPAIAKRAMWEAEDRATALEGRRAMQWVHATEAAMLARTMDDEDRAAEVMIAELWWNRMEDMLARGQDREAGLAVHHILQSDPDGRGSVLRSPCTLSVDVSEPSASVEVQPLVEERRRLVPQPGTTHPTPVVGLALPAGRYQLRIHAPDRPSLCVPVRLERSSKAALSVRLFSATERGEGFVHVPAGPFILGGDPSAPRAMPRCRPTLGDFFVQVHPVTVAEWQAFLADLDPAVAVRHVPAERSPLGPERMWWIHTDEGGWCPPPAWSPRWPVVGIDVADAEAYAEWRSARSGRPVRLPTEEEWEKVARGTDGRGYPWGDRFDPTFAHMRGSRAGRPGPQPVDAFPIDTSPFGARGMAGGVREWTASWLDAERVVVRGGSWADEAADLRCASRRGVPADTRSATVGFRLVSEVPAYPPFSSREAMR